MATDVMTERSVLERVLELSKLQLRAMEESRLVDLIRYQEERERLLTDFYNDPLRKPDMSLKPLVDEVLECDKKLEFSLEVSLSGLKEKLMALNNGVNALKAYGR